MSKPEWAYWIEKDDMVKLEEAKFDLNDAWVGFVVVLQRLF